MDLDDIFSRGGKQRQKQFKIFFKDFYGIRPLEVNPVTKKAADLQHEYEAAR